MGRGAVVRVTILTNPPVLLLLLLRRLVRLALAARAVLGTVLGEATVSWRVHEGLSCLRTAWDVLACPFIAC
jgi:hypothetical protein